MNNSEWFLVSLLRFAVPGAVIFILCQIADLFVEIQGATPMGIYVADITPADIALLLFGLLVLVIGHQIIRSIFDMRDDR